MVVIEPFSDSGLPGQSVSYLHLFITSFNSGKLSVPGSNVGFGGKEVALVLQPYIPIFDNIPLGHLYSSKQLTPPL